MIFQYVSAMCSRASFPPLARTRARCYERLRSLLPLFLSRARNRFLYYVTILRTLRLPAIMRLKIRARCHRADSGSYTRPKSQILAESRPGGWVERESFVVISRLSDTSFSRSSISWISGDDTCAKRLVKTSLTNVAHRRRRGRPASFPLPPRSYFLSSCSYQEHYVRIFSDR